MTKTTQRPVRLSFKCQRCDEEEDRNRAYTPSYDLVAHLVNKHKLFPISIRHNAPYLAVKSDLRPATAEEAAKYKNAINHWRKKADKRASTGETRVSGTTVEPEAPRGPSHESDARAAKDTADEKDLADEEADKRKYIALQNKIEARRIAREIRTAHDTLAALRAKQEILLPKWTAETK